MASKKPSRRASTPTVSELQTALANQTKRLLDLTKEFEKLKRKVPEIAAAGAKEVMKPKSPEEVAAERRAARRANAGQVERADYGTKASSDPYAEAYREHLERITPEAIRRFAGGRQELVGHRLEVALQKLMNRYPEYRYTEPKSQSEADLREHEAKRVEAEKVRREAEEAREREALGGLGLPPSQFRDPFGMIRWRSSGRRVLSDEQALDRLKEVERFNAEGQSSGAMLYLEPETLAAAAAAAMRAEETEAEAKRAPGRPKAKAPETLDEEIKQARERQARIERRRAKAEQAEQTEPSEPDITDDEHMRRRKARVAEAVASHTGR